MKKRAFVALALTIVLLLAFSSALAQEEGEEVLADEDEIVLAEERGGITPDSPLYVIDTFIDDITIASKKGSEKAEAAMKVKNERIAEAGAMVEKQNAGAAVTALENAGKAGGLVEGNKFSPSLANDTEENVKKSIATLEALKAKLPPGGLEGVEKAINAQMTQEEKIRAAKDFIKTIGDYCDALSYEDYELMQEDETCNEDKAPDWLKEYIDEDLKKREDNARVMIIDQITTCVLSPRDCDCGRIPVRRHQNECEVNKDLAIKCEYENDMEACSKLDEKELEPPEDIPPALRGIFESTLKEAIAKKEKEMFAKFRPPECADVETPRQCYDIMTNLYGTPPECEGLSEEECFEEMEKRGPPPEGERHDFPEECKEAGATRPFDCSKLMIEKYGAPEWCEGLGIDECVKESMKHGRGEGGKDRPEFPPECKEAGATKPRDCFDVMTAKHGKPPYCEGLSDDECFKESMRRGPEDHEGGPRGDMPPECEGLPAEECFEKMQEKYGIPEECKDLDRDACEEIMQAKGHVGRPGNMPPECEGLSPEECFETMVNEGKLMECEGLGVEECKEKMNERAQQHGPRQGEGGGFGQGPGPDGMPPECEGLNKEQCLDSMISAGRLPECEGLNAEQCKEKMKEFRREGEGREGEGHGGGGQGGAEGSGMPGSGAGMPGKPTECEGVSQEECDAIMRKKGEERKERGEEVGKEGEPGEHREGKEGERREVPGNIPNMPGIPRMPSTQPMPQGMPQGIPQDFPRMPDIIPEGMPSPSSGGEGSMPPQG